MTKKYIYIESLGCPKNLVDSEIFANIAIQNGYILTKDSTKADLILVNTCAFIQVAVQEQLYVINDLLKKRKCKRNTKFIVTGCLVKRYGEELVPILPQIDYFIGLKNFAMFHKLLTNEKNFSLQRTALSDVPYAYLRISDGCSNHCAYCTIPFIRGEMESFPIETLVDEANLLYQRGYKELVLIAQDLTAYGKDFSDKQLLPDLLKKIHKETEFPWIRLMYLHPKHITEELIETIAILPKIVHAFEIPIQHCNDKILSSMRRGYSKNDLEKLFQHFLKLMPDSIFRTTLITGLPGEGRKEFNELTKFIINYPFLRIGVFPYSPEEGTHAAKMPNCTSPKTATKRKNEILMMHQNFSETLLNKFVGTDVDVIIEKKISFNQAIGRAWFDAPEIDGNVYVQGTGLKKGDIVSIKIEDVIGLDLFGSYQ